jgi:hypothetical protein
VSYRLVALDKAARRTYVMGWRAHHGALGVALVLLGVYLMADDWHDRADWLIGRSRS